MTYREVVGVRYVPRLLVGTLVGRLPNGMCTLAIALVQTEAGVEFGFIGIVVGGYLTASAVAGPLLGRLVDRYGPARVMVPTALGGGAALSGLAWMPDQPEVALLLAVLAGVGTPPLEPTLRALWPRLVPDRLLKHAYGMDASSQTLIFVVGPLLVSLSVSSVGAAGAVLLAVLLMWVGVAMVVSSPAIRGGGEVALGWSRRQRGPLWVWPFGVLVLGLAGAGGAVGALNVFAVRYAEHCPRIGGPGAAGSLVATAALAGLLSGLLLTGLPLRRRRVGTFGVLMAAGNCVLILIPDCSPVAFLGAAAAGMFLPPLLGAAFGVVNSTVPPGRSAEALAWLTTIFVAGSGGATVLSGVAVQAHGAVGAATVGAAMAAAGAVVLFGVQSADG